MGLRWAVGIAKNQKVYDVDVQLVLPVGRCRKRVPSEELRPAEDVLTCWSNLVAKRDGMGRHQHWALTARFAATRFNVSDGLGWVNNRHMPGNEAWPVSEWLSSGERKFYLSNLPCRTSARALVAAITAR